MKMKRLVSGILLFVLVMAHLETLAQLETEITYGDWCAHLAELYAEGAERAGVILSGILPALGAGVALGAGIGFYDLADFEDYLDDKYWFHRSRADEYRAKGALLFVVSAVITVMYFVFVAQKKRELKTIYGNRFYSLDGVNREIELWKQAGAARMWFYPCSPNG